MNIVEKLLTNNRPGYKLIPRGVCIHWTANTNEGADAIANRNYFENNPNLGVSAHYIVDDSMVVLCIPEDEVAWHCGGSYNTDLAENKFDGNQNKYLIGIEMCVNSDGDWQKTYQNTIQLVADIVTRHNFTLQDLYRHYDLTRKDCPRMMTPYVEGGEEKWKQFKKDVGEGLLMEEIKQWQKVAGVEAIESLTQKGIINNPEQWKEELADENGQVIYTPNWLFFTIIDRITNRKGGE